MTDDERAIRGLVDTWFAASRQGDADAVLALMTDDVVFLVPGSNPIGKEEFAANFEAVRGVQIDASSDIRELQVLGEWAYMRSYMEVTVTPPGGVAPRQRAGHTLTILRKEPDGRWRVARDANLLTEQA